MNFTFLKKGAAGGQKLLLHIFVLLQILLYIYVIASIEGGLNYYFLV